MSLKGWILGSDPQEPTQDERERARETVVAWVGAFTLCTLLIFANEREPILGNESANWPMACQAWAFEHRVNQTFAEVGCRIATLHWFIPRQSDPPPKRTWLPKRKKLPKFIPPAGVDASTLPSLNLD